MQPIRFSHQAHVDYLRGGDHRREMIALHDQLMKRDQLWDQESIERVAKGECIGCHRDFDQNVNPPDDAAKLAKLSHCGECHRALLGREWETRQDQKPCMGCHNAAAESPQASIPNVAICAACHKPPFDGYSKEAQLRLETVNQETNLPEFVNQEKTIPWTRVHDYLPGDIVFSHARHVELGGVKCQECHGPVEQAEEPVSLTIKLSM